ncbi:B3/B4 domain-containing protein [Desulfovirgula thermocuniculi]|uniref:B3/B4 domain-containing protein n=1 Tax=Desulfovirgula thermocuniculi TaxID=348842 RepID=UPI000405049D|nr:phenylalanine--tRNA ligase beta subunit-related protein [Desulfovirgula thermocuniculi]
MRFTVSDEVFEMLPGVCFGVVVARDVDNTVPRPAIVDFLRQMESAVREKFQGVSVKEHPAIACYREAFKRLGMNPNKFPSSVEALVSRVVKGGQLPDINGVVNLVNALSLKYLLPMGAHDLDSQEGDLEVRFTRTAEPFVPFGGAPEMVPPGELVYADRREVRTRRWIWRQSERGKVTAESRNIFMPVDGFVDANREAVLAARDELALLLERFFRCRVGVYYLDAGCRTVEIS